MRRQLDACYETVRSTDGFAAMHDEGIRSVYEAVLRPGDLAVDGGAHSGKHTIPMARAVGPSGRIFAFEPLEEGRVQLMHALGQQGISNVAVSDLALSDEAGVEITFLYFPERPGISGFIRREGVDELEAEVRTATTTVIDDWVSEVDVAFMKLDVEGAELLALRGADATVGRSQPVIHIEAGMVSWRPYGYGPKELFEWCEQRSYSCFDLVGNELETAEDIEASFTTPGVWDYILMPAGSRDRDTVLNALRDYAARFTNGKA